MAPPPKLNAEAVSAILLRLPPDDPADLIRASAVCKPWLQILTNSTFLHRYRDFHGTSLLLGFLHNHNSADGRHARFVPTMPFRPHIAATAHRTCAVQDCRHGRVLLYDYDCEELVVWDSVTGRERRIPRKEPQYKYSHHAVLCAAGAGCDRSTCSSEGPFLVASVGTGCNNCGESVARFYSSETGEWSAETSLSHSYFYRLEDRPAALVGGVLYFDADSEELLQYDVLGDCDLWLIELPPPRYHVRPIVMAAGNGGLGLATFDLEGMLTLWSAETDTNGDITWSQIMLIDLQELIPIDISVGSAWLSGFAEEANLIFLSTIDDGIFTIDLTSLRVRKVCEMGKVDYVFPYVSFYSPAACVQVTPQSHVETQ